LVTVIVVRVGMPSLVCVCVFVGVKVQAGFAGVSKYAIFVAVVVHR